MLKRIEQSYIVAPFGRN